MIFSLVAQIHVKIVTLIGSAAAGAREALLFGAGGEHQLFASISKHQVGPLSQLALVMCIPPKILMISPLTVMEKQISASLRVKDHSPPCLSLSIISTNIESYPGCPTSSTTTWTLPCLFLTGELRNVLVRL